ncbi:FtsK/SpoIIIE domain-containing protein [Bacillus infantis]|uniref:FtsK/SpoIIIE domain-containing protein n=1 Tax=Bacillus infantis TaxID=324767 RepID=UPI003CEB816C
MSMWKKLKARKKLIDSFKAAGIHLGPDDRRIYPKIHSVSTTGHSTEFTFTLPAGINPGLLKKHEYVFHQKFGNQLEFKGEYKNFTLTVYTNALPDVLKYNHSSFLPQIEGHSIPIVAGQDANGSMVVYDMVKNPHLLIAGETGSGKSTQLRSVLSTLIQSLPPDRLLLYLCDLKRSEFHLFRQIKHVQGVYVSPGELIHILQELQGEMRHRGDMLDAHEVAHVDDLPEPPPYIILCIDEVALLQDLRKVMALIEEISAIGRALGVFLVLSMQRPDRKVLDGKLKNNLTVRMGFKCADLINSRIIGTPGSEKLKQEGRMLLKLPGLSGLQELQAPYLSIQEAKKILEPYRCPTAKGAKKGPSKSSADVIELHETENGIFEVLDE